MVKSNVKSSIPTPLDPKGSQTFVPDSLQRAEHECLAGGV